MQYSENMEEARIDKELENDRISNISIVQPATLAEKPVSPSKVFVALATMMMAAAGTGVVVLASEQLHVHRTTSGSHQNGAVLSPHAASVRRRVHRREMVLKSNGHADA
jgi:hypothetical protein